MKKTFDFGKVAYCGTRKVNRVTVSVELKKRGGETVFTVNPETGEKTETGKTPEYIEFSACGYIWNAANNDCYSCGQNLDTINEYAATLKDADTFREIYGFWKKYHLNGMNAGTPEQTAAVNAYFYATGERYDYSKACDVLRALGLYEIPFTGKSTGRVFNGETYRYGTAWIVRDIPAKDLLRIEHILSA